MNYQIITDWIKLNWIQAVLITIALVFGIRALVKKSKLKKSLQEKKEQPIQPKEEAPKAPTEEYIDLETIGNFIDMGLIENNNIENLRALKKDTEEEIKTLQEKGEGARGQDEKHAA